jgi:hypothetical protein
LGIIARDNIIQEISDKLRERKFRDLFYISQTTFIENMGSSGGSAGSDYVFDDDSKFRWRYTSRICELSSDKKDSAGNLIAGIVRSFTLSLTQEAPKTMNNGPG